MGREKGRKGAGWREGEREEEEEEEEEEDEEEEEEEEDEDEAEEEEEEDEEEEEEGNQEGGRHRATQSDHQSFFCVNVSGTALGHPGEIALLLQGWKHFDGAVGMISLYIFMGFCYILFV